MVGTVFWYEAVSQLFTPPIARTFFVLRAHTPVPVTLPRVTFQSVRHGVEGMPIAAVRNAHANCAATCMEQHKLTHLRDVAAPIISSAYKHGYHLLPLHSCPKNGCAAANTIRNA